MNLKNMSKGMEAIVTGYCEGDAAYRAKLLALGLTRGVKIRLVNRAPLGDPVEIELRGFHLSLRGSEAEVVNVREIAG